MGISIRPSEMVSDIEETVENSKRCPNCNNIVVGYCVDDITDLPGLTPDRFFRCVCGCSFKWAAHPNVSISSLIAIVPEEVKKRLREEREEELLRKKSLYWRLFHGKWA